MQRPAMIKEWLRDLFNTDNVSIEPASADASFRQYFRTTHAGVSYIVMDAPPEHESLEPFVSLATLFCGHGVHTPEVFARDDVNGFLLLSDFGSTVFLDILHTDNADDLYQQAIDELIILQRVPTDGLPIYDHALLMHEMQLFDEWYLGKHLSRKLSNNEQKRLFAIYDLLSASARSQPQVCVHRDYHSRNLIRLSDGGIGVIDFQDAQFGALTYDLASLLKDCYIEWSADQVQNWLHYFYDKHEQTISQDDDFEQFERWFDWMGMQRHLKVAGIFSRLHYRDNKPQYLNDIPLTMKYIQSMSEKYSELNLDFLVDIFE